MNMKTAYKVYLFCCVLFLTGLFLLVPVYAVEDMWTAASRIIKDIYADDFALELLYEIINKRTSQRVKLPEGVFDMTTAVHGVYEAQTQ